MKLNSLVFFSILETEVSSVLDYITFRIKMNNLHTHWNAHSPSPKSENKFLTLASKPMKKNTPFLKKWWLERNKQEEWNQSISSSTSLDCIRSISETHFMKDGLQAPKLQLLDCAYSNSVYRFSFILIITFITYL